MTRLDWAMRAGGLYVPAAYAEQARQVARELGRPNPERRDWERRKRAGRPVGEAPPALVTCDGPLDGAWSGGWWLPRYAPVQVAAVVDRTVLPPAEAVELRVEPRDYQAAARDAFLWEQAGLVVLPCGAGKTTLGLSVVASLETPALVLVHTRELAHQWAERVRAWLGCDVGIVGDGKRVDGCRVTVAILQTLATWSWWDRYIWAQRFGLVILDEAHHAPARTFADVLSSIPARYRLGLTATPTRRDGLTDFLVWSVGKPVYELAQGDLEAMGATLRPQIVHVHSTFAPSSPDIEWVQVVNELVADERRNALVLEVVREQVREGRTVLVLSDRVDHCRKLAVELEGEVLVGAITPKKRQALLERVRSGEVRVICATSVADEGLDLPLLDTVVLTCPSANTAVVQQRIGRALRPSAGKRAPRVLDLVDSFQRAAGMARARAGLYRRLGWITSREAA